ncbi:MAG: sigma-70 family RNA polymerase sigma factor [Epulopiscium sp.]|nr:sigma-70 family RNA polymerase sigma factor [Candidatus Epulonipiscium sp.]
MTLEIQMNVEKAKLGDIKAMEYLITSFKPLFYKMMLFMPSGKRDREELFQESVLILLEAVNRYDPSKNVPFEAYIRDRLKFFYYNQLKKKEADCSLDTGWEEGNAFINSLMDEESRIEDFITYKEEHKALLEAFSGLTKKQHKVIEDFYIKRKKLGMIAKEMGCSYGVAVKHKEKALLKLKKILKVS